MNTTPSAVARYVYQPGLVCRSWIGGTELNNEMTQYDVRPTKGSPINHQRGVPHPRDKQGAAIFHLGVTIISVQLTGVSKYQELFVHAVLCFLSCRLVERSRSKRHPARQVRIRATECGLKTTPIKPAHGCHGNNTVMNEEREDATVAQPSTGKEQEVAH